MGDKRKGYISVWRCIQDSAIWKTDDPFDIRSAFIDLMLSANHVDAEIIVNRQPLLVRRGQKFTSVRKLADTWNWSEKRVTRYLKLLKKLGMLECDATRNGTLITLVNYGIYQLGDTPTTTPMTTPMTEPPSEGGYTRGTHGRPTNNNVNNINNVNNVNNIKKGGPVYNSEGELLE